MGRSVNLYSYDYEKLKNELIKYCGAKTEEETKKLEEILTDFGNIIGDRYIILNNEFWEDYSCYYNVASVIDNAFGRDDSFGEVFCVFRDETMDKRELISATAKDECKYYDEEREDE